MFSNTKELKRFLMVSDIKSFKCLYRKTGVESGLPFLFSNASIIFEVSLASEITNSNDLPKGGPK